MRAWRTVAARFAPSGIGDVRFLDLFLNSRRTATVESFRRRQASESLRCPNRGGHEPSYGESCFAQVVVLDVAAQNRTYLRSDRLNLDCKSGRRKADGPILRFRRLLLGRASASVSASGRRAAPGIVSAAVLIVGGLIAGIALARSKGCPPYALVFLWALAAIYANGGQRASAVAVACATAALIVIAGTFIGWRRSERYGSS